MSKKMLWAVSTGEYSDYHVDCLFTTKELAEEHATQRNGNESGNYFYDQARVEAFWLLDRPPKRVMQYSRSAHVYSDGRVEKHELYKKELFDYDVEIVRGRPEGHTSDLLVGDRVYVSVTGANEKQVEKAFNDRVMQAQAMLTQRAKE